MRRHIVTSMSAVALLVCWGTANAQVNPSGWIQTDGWNMLFPLTQFGSCGGGGPDNMAGNWIAPHVIGVEDPKGGSTVYFANTGKSARIDFNNTALSTGWGGAGLSPDPAWITNAYVESVFVGTTAPNGDVVDFQGLVDFLNGPSILGTLGPGVPGLQGDNVLGIATTYVQNTTGAPLEVVICTASDDSDQVWINDQLVTNVSACRGTAGDCAERRVAVLPVGVSKIAVLVWEGGGGWGFRLAIEVGGVRATDAAGLGLTFLGAGVAATVGQLNYNIARTHNVPLRCVTAGPVTVSLKGSGPGADGDPLVVEEQIFGVGADISVTNTGGGVVTDIVPPPPTPPTPVGLHFADRRAIGTPCNAAGNMTTYNAGTLEYTSVAQTGVDIWDGGDAFEFAYTRVAGDFDVSIKFISKTHETGVGEWGKFGLMARDKRQACSRFTMMQDHLPLLSDPQRQAGRTDFNGCNAMYEEAGFATPPSSTHSIYQRLTRVGNVIRGWVSDNPAVEGDPTNDSLWQMNNRGDDWGSAPSVYLGLANSVHNSSGCAKQTLVFQVLNATATPVPLDDPPAPIGKLITYTTTRGAVNTGLSYDVDYAQNNTVRLVGTANNAAAISSGPEGTEGTLSFASNATGPIGVFDNAHDVGGRQGSGTFTFDGVDTYSLTAAGDDIWAGGDQFGYFYKVVTGDFDLSFHIASRTQPPSGRWGKHGPMARWDCAFNSRFMHGQANLQVQPNPDPQTEDIPRVARRVVANDTGNTQETYFVDDGTFPTERRWPTWMRMARKGTGIHFWMAEEDTENPGNPISWVSIGSDNDPMMPDTILAGVALTSHDGGNLAGITFDHVSFTLLPDEPEVCSVTAEVTSTDFEAPDGTVLPSPFVTVVGGAFGPQVVGNRLRLAQEGTNDTANALWFPTDGLSVAASGFVAEFDAFMTHTVPGNPADANPADGMTFAVVEGNAGYAVNLRGDGGGALGFEGNSLRGLSEGHRSFAIEMDNWVGGGNPWTEQWGSGSPDFDFNYHLGVDINSSVSSIQTNLQFGVRTNQLPDIFHANGVHFEVRYSPKGNIDVYVSGMRGATVVPRIQVLSAAIPPLTGPDLLLGWTAGTGGANCTMEIDNASLSSICCENADETIAIDGPTTADTGTNATLTTTVTGEDAGGTPTYSWTIVEGAPEASFVGPTDGSSVQVTSTINQAVKVRVTYDDGLCTLTALTPPVSADFTITFGPVGGTQKPGDFNQDGLFNLSDPIATLNHLFSGGTAPPCGDNTVTDAANIALLDGNGDAAINLSDPIYDLNFLFSGGPKPVACADITCACIVIPGCPNLAGVGDCP